MDRPAVGKLIVAVGLAMMSAVTCSAQKSLDWSACQSAEGQLKSKIEELRKSIPEGFRLDLSCVYEGTPSENKKAPVVHVKLTAAEIKTLHEYRDSSKAAFDLLVAFEEHLKMAHHLPRRDVRDPCYSFIGFVLDDDFITYDPNPMMPWDCQAGGGGVE